MVDYEADYPSAVSCFMDDFEVCIAHLCTPITYCRATRITNLLERLFVEERRRSAQHHAAHARREGGPAKEPTHGKRRSATQSPLSPRRRSIRS